MFSPFSPVDIRILGRQQALDTVEGMLHGAQSLLVVAGEAMVKRLHLQPFLDGLLARHKGAWLSRVPANPSVSDVLFALRALEGGEPSAILAIGGGSAIDLGKAVAALVGLWSKDWREEDVRGVVACKAYASKQTFPALVAMPTTAGTGSEVTRWATVWDTAQGQKLSIDHIGLFPKAAVIVPEFTFPMGPELTLSSGLDALSHAMESYWANSRTPLSQALSLAALQKIKQCLPQAARPENASSQPVREGMCLGALLAGLAFSMTRTTACHAISYPMTMLYGLPHGFAAAMTLDSVMTRNEAYVPEIREIRRLFSEDGGFRPWLDHLAEPVRPLRLGGFGIGQDQLAAIAGMSFTAGRMDNNPVSFTALEVADILKECL